MNKKTLDRRHRRYCRWELRCKGYKLATIECLGFFKLHSDREQVDVELWPLNDAARNAMLISELLKEVE